jgi:2-keto-3-deoxy-L-rhamnonate aldolase RhmA
MNEVYTQTCWIIARDGIAEYLRGTADLAVRQGKIVKTQHPDSVVTLHYAENSSRAYYNGEFLVVEIKAQLSHQTIYATFN